jgi:hypothetical protein
MHGLRFANNVDGDRARRVGPRYSATRCYLSRCACRNVRAEDRILERFEAHEAMCVGRTQALPSFTPRFSRSSQLELIYTTLARHTHRLHGWGKPRDA